VRGAVRALWLLALTVSAAAQAHIASNGFLVAQVHGERLEGSLELALRDVELAVGVDANHDGKITWGELRAGAPRLEDYVAAHLAFSAQQIPCPIQFAAVAVNTRVDGAYAWLPWSADCGSPVRQLRVRYDLMQDIDPSHRGLLTLTAGSVTQTAVLGGTAPSLALDVAHPARWRTFTEYLAAGVWHILSGIDHLLFLISLLLPAVLLRNGGRWQPVPAARPAFFGIFKVVTAFTVAHSITLALAAFDIVRLPSRFTESAIAASIVVAALNNLFPVVTAGRARIAFAFGLLHGFGFASVLSEMGLPQGARVLSLFAFNLGIECGQLAVVLLVMPLAYQLRGGTLYRRVVLPAGSAAVALLAAIWLAQRALGP
jgi:hypothetical protein